MFRLQISAFLLLALVMSIYSAPRGHYKKKKVEVSAPSQRSHSANDNKKVAEDAARREEEVALLEELLDLMAEGEGEGKQYRDAYRVEKDGSTIKVSPDVFDCRRPNSLPTCLFDIRVFLADGTLVTRNDKTVSYDYNSNMGVTLNVAESCSGDCYVQTCHVDSGGNHIGRGCDCWKCEGTDRLCGRGETPPVPVVSNKKRPTSCFP